MVDATGTQQSIGRTMHTSEYYPTEELGWDERIAVLNGGGEDSGGGGEEEETPEEGCPDYDPPNDSEPAPDGPSSDTSD